MCTTTCMDGHFVLANNVFDYSAEQFDQRESFGRKEKKGKLLQSESLLASDVAGAGATHTYIYI